MNPKNPNSGRYASDGQDHDDLSYLGNLADSDDPPYPDPFFETPYDFNTPADFGGQGAPSQALENEAPAGASMEPISSSKKTKKTPSKKAKLSLEVKQGSSNTPVQQTPSGAFKDLQLDDDMGEYKFGDLISQVAYRELSQSGMVSFGQSRYPQIQDGLNSLRQSPFTPSQYSPSGNSLPVQDPEWDHGATPRESGRLTYRDDNIGDDAPTVDDGRVNRSQNNLQKYKSKVKADKDPNGRQKGRNLVQWGRPNMFTKLCLHIQYECWRQGIQIPWDEIAQRLNPGSSGPAILQALNRERDVLIAKGHMIPPNMGNFKAVRADQIRGYIHDDRSASPWAVVAIRWDDKTYQDPIHERQDNRIAWGSGKYPRGKGPAPKHLRPSSKRFRLPDEDKAKVKEDKKKTSVKKQKSKSKVLVKNELDSDDDIDPALLKSDDEYDPGATKSKRKRGARAGGSRKKSRLEIDSPELTPTKASKSKGIKPDLSALVVLRISPYELFKFPPGESRIPSRVQDDDLGARVPNRPQYRDGGSTEDEVDSEASFENEVEESDGDDEEVDIENQLHPLSPGILDYQNPFKQSVVQSSTNNSRAMQPGFGNGAGLSQQDPADDLPNNGNNMIQQDQEDIFRQENPGEDYIVVGSAPPYSLDPNHDADDLESQVPRDFEEEFIIWEAENRRYNEELDDINRDIGEVVFDHNGLQHGRILESGQGFIPPVQQQGRIQAQQGRDQAQQGRDQAQKGRIQPQQGRNQAQQGPRVDHGLRFYTPEGHVFHQKGLIPFDEINHFFDPALYDQPLSEEELAAAAQEYAPGGRFYQGPKSDRAQ